MSSSSQPGRELLIWCRYSAATCDPSEFFEKKFTLRQQLFAKPRHTELFIVVTMYNEDEVLFARTMSGVFKNIAYLCSRTRSQTWGEDAWKKVVVCVVSDGRGKINPRTRSVLAGMGCYQEGIAKTKVNEDDVTAHIYEVSSPLRICNRGKDTNPSLVHDAGRHRARERYGETLPHGEKRRPSADDLLSQRAQPEENQLSPLVLPGLRACP